MNKNINNEVALKMLIVGVLIVLCLVPSYLVLSVVHNRQSYHQEAKQDITSTWAAQQTIGGPMLIIPYTLPQKLSDGSSLQETRHAYVFPQAFTVRAAISPEWRSRGIFRTVVYSGTINSSGKFSLPDFGTLGIPAHAVIGQPFLSFPISDSRGIEKNSEFRWNGETLELEPGSGANALSTGNGGGMHKTVAIAPHTDYTFTSVLQLRGSESINFLPIGKETRIEVTSPWQSPRFAGAFLPKERTITPQGFSAIWEISSLARSYPQFGSETDIDTDRVTASEFGVAFDEGILLYTMVERTVKYAILFIGLTFFAFFLFEVLNGLRLHPFQYLLVGCALALFYPLLLSLAEYIGYPLAYLSASAATVLLITWYCLRILQTKKRGLLIAGVLSGLYAYLYFTIQLEEFSLLIGSLLLFVVLAAVMYLTRNVNWYQRNSNS